jgi:hypothetical protein
MVDTIEDPQYLGWRSRPGLSLPGGAGQTRATGAGGLRVTVIRGMTPSG